MALTSEKLQNLLGTYQSQWQEDLRWLLIGALTQVFRLILISAWAWGAWYALHFESKPAAWWLFGVTLGLLMFLGGYLRAVRHDYTRQLDDAFDVVQMAMVELKSKEKLTEDQIKERGDIVIEGVRQFLKNLGKLAKGVDYRDMIEKRRPRNVELMVSIVERIESRLDDIKAADRQDGVNRAIQLGDELKDLAGHVKGLGADLAELGYLRYRYFFARLIPVLAVLFLLSWGVAYSIR